MTFGERIKKLRKKNNYSQEQLASKLNMSRQSIAKWESDVCEPNLECIIKMSNIFNVSLDYLIKGEEYMNENNSNKEIVYIKEPLLDKIDILSLILLLISLALFIGLFIYAVLNPMYYKSHESFIWWYIRINVSTGTTFRLFVLLSIIGIIISIKKFLKRRKKR